MAQLRCDIPMCEADRMIGLGGVLRTAGVFFVSKMHQFAVHDSIVSIGHCQSIELLQLLQLDSKFTNILTQYIFRI